MPAIPVAKVASAAPVAVQRAVPEVPRHDVEARIIQVFLRGLEVTRRDRNELEIQLQKGNEKVEREKIRLAVSSCSSQFYIVPYGVTGIDRLLFVYSHDQQGILERLNFLEQYGVRDYRDAAKYSAGMALLKRVTPKISKIFNVISTAGFSFSPRYCFDEEAFYGIGCEFSLVERGGLPFRDFDLLFFEYLGIKPEIIRGRKKYVITHEGLKKVSERLDMLPNNLGQVKVFLMCSLSLKKCLLNKFSPLDQTVQVDIKPVRGKEELAISISSQNANAISQIAEICRNELGMDVCVDSNEKSVSFLSNYLVSEEILGCLQNVRIEPVPVLNPAQWQRPRYR